ncbi:MAG TPA: dihydropteroate synthase [Candidatus Saccharimonadales bacterium]|jgi:dihydropteroate synthase|nr:dihydropteroate synthase [Candidatus Saccharimonadales bacterium]
MVQLVGILNVTPDSFSDGNQFLEPEKAIERVIKLFKDGAALVDIGAESTRPGATKLTPDQEWQRLEPVLEKLLKRFSGKLSVDTYHPETAERALKLGEVIINDVTGMNNMAMIEVVSRFRARCIVSQLPAADTQTAHDGALINDQTIIKNDLLAKANLLKSKGLKHSQIILDPGIGFGKTPELNQKLLRFAEQLPDYQVMIGYSRKRFLGDHRMELEPNLAAGRIAIAAGAAYLRVHDVAGHRQLLQS